MDPIYYLSKKESKYILSTQDPLRNVFSDSGLLGGYGYLSERKWFPHVINRSLLPATAVDHP